MPTKFLNNHMLIKIRVKTLLILFTLIHALYTNYSYADDVDVFRAFTDLNLDNPKILFMADTSASMRCAVDFAQEFNQDCQFTEHAQQRMTQVQQALHDWLLDLSSHTAVGLGRYTGPGGAIMAPVLALNQLRKPTIITTPGKSFLQYESVSVLRNPKHDVFYKMSQWSSADQEGQLELSFDQSNHRLRLQFLQIQIPPGAEITQAALVLRSATTDTHTPTVDIAIDPEFFPYDALSTAPSPKPSFPWQQTRLPLNAWPEQGAFHEIDVTQVLQQRIQDAQQPWCFGQSLSFVVKPHVTSANTSKKLYSLEGDASGAPRLYVRYRLPNRSSSFSTPICRHNQTIGLLKTAEDDQSILTQAGDQHAELTLAPAQQGASFKFSELRFEQAMPGSIQVNSAHLTVVPSQNSSAPLLMDIYAASGDVATISHELLAKAAQGTATLPNGLSIVGPLRWEVTQPWLQNLPVQSPDLSSLIQQTVTDSTWSNRSTLGLILLARSGERKIYSVERGQGLQAKLDFSWQGTYPLSSGLTHRLKLLQDIYLLPQNGYTPTAGALLEAAHYLLGKTVEFGASRGDQGNAFAIGPDFRQTHTVSAASTYSGGASITGLNNCSGLDDRNVSCIDEQITGNPIYQSPFAGESISDTVCQNTHIVILTDGYPNEEVNNARSTTSGNSLPDLIHTLTSGNCEDSQFPQDVGQQFQQSFECSAQIAKFLNHQAQLNGKPISIKTHTILFAFNSPQNAFELLVSEDYGGGLLRLANNEGELLEALRKVSDVITGSTITLTNPVVAVNQLGRMQHMDQVYFSLFKPSNQLFWTGNLKRYRVDFSSGNLVDARDLMAIDTKRDGRNFFRKTARSFWSKEVDGNEVELGGAAERLSRYVNTTGRQVFTFTGEYKEKDWALVPDVSLGFADELADPQNRFDLSGTQNSDHDVRIAALMGLPGTDPSLIKRRQTIANWARGLDTTNLESGTRNEMGAFIHSGAVLINYGYDNPGANKPVPPTDPDLQHNTLFISSNQGFLHAIDAKTGDELFSFIPPELIQNLPTLAEGNLNDEANPLLYGLDTTWTAWRYDAFVAQPDGSFTRDDIISTNKHNRTYLQDDHVFVYAGMRRGGSNYYALDVTQSSPKDIGTRIKPKLKFVIRGGQQVAPQNPYYLLGQTWSQPVLAQIRLQRSGKSTVFPVIFFAGGYDPSVYDMTSQGLFPSEFENPSPHAKGSALYMVDANTGELLWWAAKQAGNARHPELRHSITAKLKTLDLDGDGLTDRLYFVDLGGQVFRIELDNGKPQAANTPNELAKIYKIAELAGSGRQARRFFEAPSVAIMPGTSDQRVIGIAAASGYRPSLQDEFLEDGVFVLFDEYDTLEQTPPVITANQLTTLNLADTSGIQLQANTLGWRVTLGDRGAQGEKVLGSPLIFRNRLLFVSYVPKQRSAVPVASCAQVDEAFGLNRLYILEAKTGASTSAFNKLTNIAQFGSHRYIEDFTSTLAATPQMLVGPNGQYVLMVGAEIFRLSEDVNIEGGSFIRTKGWRRVE